MSWNIDETEIYSNIFYCEEFPHSHNPTSAVKKLRIPFAVALILFENFRRPKIDLLFAFFASFVAILN